MLDNLLRREKPQPPRVLEPEVCAPRFTMQGGVELGQDCNWNPCQLPNAHVVVIGSSGSGKTQTLKALALALSEHFTETQIIIIDFHGDQSLKGETCYPLNMQSPHGINPLAINLDPEGGGVNLQALSVLAILERALAPLGANQKGALLDVLNEAYQRRGISQDDRSTWTKEPPTFADLQLIIVEREDGKLMLKMAQTFAYGIFSRPQPAMTEHVVRLDVSKLPPHLQAIAAECFARQLLAAHRLAGEIEGQTPRTFLFIDEAKEMPRDHGSACDRIIADGRKYGLALVLASQSERHLSLDVISNSSTKIVLPVDQTEVRAVARKFRFNESRVAALAPLTALCRFGQQSAQIAITPYFRRVAA